MEILIVLVLIFVNGFLSMSEMAVVSADLLERDDGTYIVDGRYSFYDFLSYFDKEELFDEDFNFNTVSGLSIDILQEIPVEGQIIRWHGFTFEIIDMDAARIDKILVKITDK